MHQKSPSFFNAKSPGKVKEKTHKSFLESGQANISRNFPTIVLSRNLKISSTVLKGRNLTKF